MSNDEQNRVSDSSIFWSSGEDKYSTRNKQKITGVIMAMKGKDKELWENLTGSRRPRGGSDACVDL